jgi:hypothetical protein
MELYSSTDGTPLDEIEPFMEELTGIVKEMQQLIPMETRILEGTEMPAREDIVIPPPENPQAILEALTGKNELSQGETKEDQWSNASPNGCLTTDRIRISTRESDNSACIAALFNQNCPIRRSNAMSSPMSVNSCAEMSGGCGCAIDVTKGPCACMEQTISVPMAGTPSEEK